MYILSCNSAIIVMLLQLQHCKKFGVGENLAKLSHSENVSKFIKICQVKT